MKTKIKPARNTTFLVVCSGLAAALGAHAAVYNLYFNNTEQGDNSTANPQVKVEQTPDGVVVAKKPSTDPASPAAAPSNAAPATPPTAAGAPNVAEGGSASALAAIASTSTSAPSRQNFRMDLSGFLTHSRGFDSGGLGGSFSCFPLPYLGFGAFAGAQVSSDAYQDVMALHGGAEIEVVPLKLNLFGFQDAFKISTLAGFSSLGRVSHNVAALFAGARVGLNFGSRWTLAARVRGNAGFVMGDASLGYRF